jgi:hypothetical protein
MTQNLTKSDLETPRHACELYDWVRRIQAEFGKTAEGKKAMRLQSKPYLKEFCEELWPLANYAKAFYGNRSDVSFKPVIGNQSHDAELIDDKSGSTLCYFEITQALDDEAGYQERLRMEHLVQHGHAPLTGPPLTRSRRGVVQQEDEVSEDRDRAAETICLIRKAIQKKANKSYRANTVLIVEFFDYLPLQCQEGYKKRLDAAAKSELCGIACPFSELALIARSGEFPLRYPNPGASAAS